MERSFALPGDMEYYGERKRSFIGDCLIVPDSSRGRLGMGGTTAPG